MMKIICNRFIPFPGFIAVNLFGILFVRKEYAGKITAETLNHEAIHSAQMRELLWIGFYLWYLSEWIVRLFMPGDAYRSVCFEREAYENEREPEYLGGRKRFAFWKYYKIKE